MYKLSVILVLFLSSVCVAQRDYSRYNIKPNDPRMTLHGVIPGECAQCIQGSVPFNSSSYRAPVRFHGYPVISTVEYRGGLQLFNQSGAAVSYRNMGYFYNYRTGTLYINRPAYVGVVMP